VAAAQRRRRASEHEPGIIEGKGTGFTDPRTSKQQTQRNKTKLTIHNDIMPALSGQNVQVEVQAESSDETDIVSGYPDGVVWTICPVGVTATPWES